MISKALTMFLLMAAAAPPPVTAQDRPEQTRPSNTSPTRPPSDEGPPASNANIRVELTISDYVGSAAPVKKTVSMIVADDSVGRIRSLPRNGGGPMLNVDATPRVIGTDRLRLRLTLEYSPANVEKMPRGSPINEMVTVMLQSGKPMTITQGADPSMDRHVTVDVTATILK